jgi:membrane protease YdiL (CAAX protease family)
LLIGGLFVVGLYVLVSFFYGQVTLAELGLGNSHSWGTTFGFGIVGLGLMLAVSPVADRIASHWFAKPPTLEVFGAIQQSRGKLIAGIIAAWVMGGFLEEMIARGIVLTSLATFFAAWISLPIASAAAICITAIGAGLMHSYQGPRAVLIITQLSILLGLLFVISGFNLWAVMLCHGLYDTIAFVRFANKKSRYANNGQNTTSPPVI